MALLRRLHRLLHSPENRHSLIRSFSCSDAAHDGLSCRGMVTWTSVRTTCGILGQDFRSSEFHSTTSKWSRERQNVPLPPSSNPRIDKSCHLQKKEDNESSSILLKFVRQMSTQGKVSPQQLRQGALKVTMLSPGFIFEPYKPQVPIPFWKRWFTPSGWRRTKEDVIMELKNAYAIAQLRKKGGYSKKLFYQEAIALYTEVNILLANGDKASLRKLVTENMFSNLKNDLKRRESIWSSVYWELVQPVVRIRTLRARLIGVDKNDLGKSFIQLTIEFLTKQKFEAYDSNGVVISGDKTKEVLVRDIWVFERSLFHPGAYWRVCARLSL